MISNVVFFFIGVLLSLRYGLWPSLGVVTCGLFLGAFIQEVIL